MAAGSRIEVVYAISDLLDSHCKDCEAKTEYYRKYGGNTSFITQHCAVKCPIGGQLADLGKQLTQHSRPRKKPGLAEEDNAAKLPNREQLLSMLAEGKTQIQIESELDLDINSLNYRIEKWGLRGITPEAAAALLAAPAAPIIRKKRENRTMANVMTKEQYLARRLTGEKRTNIVRSMGMPTQKAYNLLKEWGIREPDAEERELDLFAARKNQAVPVASAESAETRDEAPADSAPDEIARLQEELQQEREAHSRCMQQADDFAAALSDRDRTIAELRSRAADRSSLIADLEAERDTLRSQADPLLQRIEALEEENKRLGDKLEDVYLANIDLQQQANGFIQLRLPVLPAEGPNQQRAVIYDLIETLTRSVEPAVIERGDIMLRMFELLQQMVAFVIADMGELLPGQDLTQPAQRFFEFHNARYIEAAAIS